MARLVQEVETFKHIIIVGRGFQGVSDEKMRRMWLGREIGEAGLPPIHCRSLPLRVDNQAE